MRAALLSTLVAALFAGPAFAESGPPLVVLQTKPIGQLLDDGRAIVQKVGDAASRYDAAVAGREPGTDAPRKAQDLVGSVFAFFGDKLGKDWDQHIDASRPVLGYAAYDLENPEASPAVLLVPVKGQPATIKRFLDRIATVGPEKEGVFSLQIGGNWTAQCRIRAGVLYLATGEASLSGTLVEADKLVGTLDDQLVAVRAYPSQLPPVLKQIIQFSFDAALQEALRKADEDPELPATARKFQKDWIRRFMTTFLDVIREGDETSIGLVFDRKTGQMGLDARLTPKSGTALAKTVASVETFQSPLAGVLDGEPALRGSVNMALPIELGKLILESARHSHEQENAPTDDEKAEFEKYLSAFRPTLEGGSMQFALAVHRSNDHTTLTGGLALKDAAAVEKMLRASAPEGLVELDAEKVAGVSVHHLTPPDGFPEELEGVFGDGPLLFAFRKDAMVFAFGKAAKERLAVAIKAPAKAVPQLEVVGSIRQILPLIKGIDAGTAKMVETVMGKGADKLSAVKVEWSGGRSFRSRFTSEVLELAVGAMIAERARARIE